HQQARQLLHNKFVVVLGDSIQRAVYKDIVLLLQKDSYLTVKQLKSKGEMSFEQDCLVEGGCLSQMHNGTAYREVRQFRSAHHLVRFYFVTRIYSRYMMSILEDFHSGLKPDIVIVNSCIWDISRLDYCIAVSQLRHDVIVANFYSGSLADSYGLDVLDLHFQFRFSLQHRTKDGVHWNAIAHRRITCLLLQHSAQAWGVVIPHPPTAVAEKENCSDPSKYTLLVKFWKGLACLYFKILAMCFIKVRRLITNIPCPVVCQHHTPLPAWLCRTDADNQGHSDHTSERRVWNQLMQ
uniref:Family with sequence similarity 113 n=1 Tax=Mola mola TaxID=94237 RepID=A0A3Q3X909_MOLML